MANLFFKSPITVPSIFHIPDKSMIMNYFSMLFIALSNNCLIFAMPYRQCRRAASKTMKNKAVMTETNERKLPVGIQSFKKIREEGYLYVDKTEMVWNLANKGARYDYLSRPRRFGKSVLVDTLQCYFEGRKELFEGLKIMEMEKDWTCHPVIRLDMSNGSDNAKDLEAYLDFVFSKYEKLYDTKLPDTASLTVRFSNIIETANKVTGKQVVILIDEYDSPLQHSWKTPEHENCTRVYRSVFSVLKTLDEIERFVFITGITKFTQISLFSVLNNLSNISFDAEYAGICGITQQELTDNFMPETSQMAEANGWTTEETLRQLKTYYDGYHFCRKNMIDVYNPYSLVHALATKDLRSFWASSGATTALAKFVNDMEIRLKDLDQCAIISTTIESSDVTGGGAELFMYQSGYLTIKGYTGGTYMLGIPNHEVRQALYEMVLPALAMRKGSDIQSAQAFLNLNLYNGNMPEAMKQLKALVADVPYSNKKLASMDMEERYRLIISTILNAIGLRVEVEKMISTGRIDIVAENSTFIYVMELKLTKNGGVNAAEKQITDNRYTEPFKADKRKTIALAIELDDLGKGLLEWKQL